jgi:DNA-binding PadR family transcriptional regulator
VFHILLALAGGRKHGYAIMKEVTEDADEADADERRRYYQLTNAGRRALGGEAARLRQALSAAKRKGVAAPVRAAR